MLKLLILAALLIPPLAFFERWSDRFVLRHPEQEWAFEHAWLPFARALVLIIMILGSYPDVFHLLDAPTLSVVLAGNDNWLDHAINLVLLLGFVLPLIPVIGQLPGIVLPAQAWGMTALLATWTAETFGILDFSIWPGIPNMLAMLGFALAGHYGHRLLPGSLKSTHWSAATLAIVAQLPAIAIYGLALGAKIQGT